MTDDDDWYDSYDDYEECPTCKGRGTVNPLTAPDWYLCSSTTTCPTCEGTGEMP